MRVQRRPASVEQQVRAQRDLRLINEYRRGRTDAFDEIVRTYEATVRRVLTQLGVAAADVDDLVQDVFVRVYRNLQRFGGRSSFYTWLYRITVNVFFDHRKSRKRADARLQRLRTAFVDASTLRPEDDDPFRAAHERLTSETFALAIATLPEPFRNVVSLREVDDLSYEEIAAQTGTSVGTVRSRLSRARARLKTLLRGRIGLEAAA